MPSRHFRDRRAASIENAELRVTVLEEGGHIAEITDKRTGVNPLWIPPWPSIEPSTYEPSLHPEYGSGAESRLLSGIMGHNLCLDIFGGPSAEEEAAGLTVHGEASIARYDVQTTGHHLTMRAELPIAQLVVERQIEVRGQGVRIREIVENPGGADRPIGWTQHVTLGPPFLEKNATQFQASATRSLVLDAVFGAGDYLRPGAEFTWPHAPRADGRTADLRTFTNEAVSSAYTTHAMDPGRPHAYFVAFSPALRLSFGYVWKRAEFPWLGIWEENYSRAGAPWLGKTLTRGMEFGVSPIPETRRQMIDRGRLFDVPTYRWIPARTRVEVEYWALCRQADAIPDALEFPT
jgi:hypothetical protein